MPTEEYYGRAGRGLDKSDYNAVAFVVRQLINQLATVQLVKVVRVENAGGVEPVGFVDVQPLVHQVTGNGQPVPHGTIHGVPYLRLQGGANAVILDPQVGDVGMCGFCSRDISKVKETKDAAPPGSFRKYDWADGLYLGGFLNGAPEQYVRFSAEGIELVSPTRVTISAPEIDIQASDSVTINSPSNSIQGGGTSIDGRPFLPHTHGNVQSGGSQSGPVT